MDSNSLDMHLECVICEHSYDSDAKRPLELPCSHCFCHDCLQQIDATSKKLCPICRRTWSDIQLADLPLCYQAVPPNFFLFKDNQEVDNVLTFPLEACSDHDEDEVFWCETCRTPVCKTCWGSKHNSCDMLFVTEKWEALKEDYTSIISSLKTAKQSKLPSYLADNEKQIESVQHLKNKLAVLEQNLFEHQKRLEAWDIEVGTTLSEQAISRVTSQQDVPKIIEEITAIKHLEQELPPRPSSLLLQITESYQDSSNDLDAFINHLHRTSEESQPVNSCQHVDANQSIEEFPLVTLTEGAEWEIWDSESAAAVDSMILTTSTGPSKLKVSWTAQPQQVLGSLLSSNQAMEVHFVLDCFTRFNLPSQETKALTSSFIDSMRRCKVVQFWGHLDPNAVEKLPKTIQNLGLVLRDKEDMVVVNDLCGIIFSTQYHPNARHRLLWPHLTQINLSVSKTFSAQYWKLSWAWKLYKNLSSYSAISLSALRSIGIHFNLHLPHVVPIDADWMRALLSAIKPKIADPIPLFLPGACIHPEPLLGVLRDSGQSWEVHLPSSLPHLVPRGTVAERYKGHGQYVTWDLE